MHRNAFPQAKNGSLGNSNWFPTRNHAESAGSAAWFPDLVWLMDRNGRERSDWVGAPLHNIMRCHAVQYNIHQYYIYYLYIYTDIILDIIHCREIIAIAKNIESKKHVLYNWINYINCVSRRKTQRFGSCWGSGAKAAPASSWVSSLRCHTSQPQPWLDEYGWPMDAYGRNQNESTTVPVPSNTWSSRRLRQLRSLEQFGTLWNNLEQLTMVQDGSRDLIWKLVWLTWCGCFGVYLQYQQIRRIAFAAIIHPLV